MPFKVNQFPAKESVCWGEQVVLQYEGAEEEDEPHDSTFNVTSRFL